MNRIEEKKKNMQKNLAHKLGLENPLTIWFCSVCEQVDDIDIVNSCYNTCLLYEQNN